MLDFQSIVGEEQCKDIVSDYLRKRGEGGPSELFTFHDPVEALEDTGLQAYVKPKEDEIWSAGSKKTTKVVKPKTEAQGSAPPVIPGGLCYYNLDSLHASWRKL